jgi:hypothetical protein
MGRKIEVEIDVITDIKSARSYNTVVTKVLTNVSRNDLSINTSAIDEKCTIGVQLVLLGRSSCFFDHDLDTT